MRHKNVLVAAAPPVVTVSVNRPQVLNALDETTLKELSEVFRDISVDPAVRCVILTGSGEKAFVAGADIAAMVGLGPPEALAFAELGHNLLLTIEALGIPVIAAVNGFALGGGLELALACDLVVAVTTAELGLPELALGIIPGFGGIQRVVRRVGLGRAREMVYNARLLSAREALHIGLINEVAEPGHLMNLVSDRAGAIGALGARAVAESKRALREGLDLTLAEALRAEREAFAGLFGTEDQKEGMRAFLEKRPARFRR